MDLIRHEILSGERRFSDVAREQEFAIETTDWTAEICHPETASVLKHRYTSPTTGKPRVCVEFVLALPPDGTESEVWIFDAASDITPSEFDKIISEETQQQCPPPIVGYTPKSFQALVRWIEEIAKSGKIFLDRSPIFCSNSLDSEQENPESLERASEMKIKGSKAVSYLRVSGKAQVKGDGFPRQRAKIREYAKAHGVEVVEEFKDGGVSGTKESADRPGLSALIERLAGNGVRLILIERADRLARDLIVSEMLLEEFRKMGVTVIEADGGTDLSADSLDDPTKTLIRQVLGAVSQFEKSVIVGKLKGARERVRREKGRCEGVKPFGALPGEEPTVERIRELNRKPRGGKRLSTCKIAARLQEEGHATRSGAPWNAGTVRKILIREKLPRD